MALIFKGKIGGITLQHGGKAEYKVKSEESPPDMGYFYFTFTGPRNLYELEEKVKIAVEGQ